ncbi:hypothetical protein H0173_15410 [Bacillus sp. S/N-304-OC-R1]|nr:hypothetical protein [Bacillus sp. S/N-304-OC-R1]
MKRNKESFNELVLRGKLLKWEHRAVQCTRFKGKVSETVTKSRSMSLF